MRHCADHTPTSPPPWLWVLTGLALDGAGFLAFFASLPAASGTEIREYWLCSLALIAVPWTVHVILLPRLFGTSSRVWTDVPWLLVKGVLLAAVATIVIPSLGGFVLFLIAIPLEGAIMISQGSYNLTDWPDWASVSFGIAWPMIAAAPVGAFLGGVMHALRTTSFPSPANGENPDAASVQPRLLSDIQGGSGGAVLVFALLWASSSLFYPPVPFNPSVSPSFR